jgi:hypothetical protein
MLSGSGSVTDKNVGIAKAISLGNLALGDGTNGGLASNYSFSSATPSLTITRLPSVTWVGGSSGNWSTASNWGGGAIPDGSNVKAVTILSAASVTYDSTAGNSAVETLTSSGKLVLSGGSLNIASGLNTQGFEQSGGTLKATGSSAAPVQFTVSGNLSQSVGSTLALNNATVNITQTDGNLNFSNTGIVTFNGLSALNGNITVNNIGAVTTSGPVTANDVTGKVSITANSPLTIGGLITAGGDISLIAGATPGGINDILTISGSGSVLSIAGNINLSAGNGINATTGSLSAPKGNVNRQANLNSPTNEVQHQVDSIQNTGVTGNTTSNSSGSANSSTSDASFAANTQASNTPVTGTTGSTPNFTGAVGGTIGGTAGSFGGSEVSSGNTTTSSSSSVSSSSALLNSGLSENSISSSAVKTVNSFGNSELIAATSSSTTTESAAASGSTITESAKATANADDKGSTTTSDQSKDEAANRDDIKKSDDSSKDTSKGKANAKPTKC